VFLAFNCRKKFAKKAKLFGIALQSRSAASRNQRADGGGPEQEWQGNPESIRGRNKTANAFPHSLAEHSLAFRHFSESSGPGILLEMRDSEMEDKQGQGQGNVCQGNKECGHRRVRMRVCELRRAKRAASQDSFVPAPPDNLVKDAPDHPAQVDLCRRPFPLSNADKSPQNEIKFFSTAEVTELAKDRACLAKITQIISQHWHKKNVRQKGHAGNGEHNGSALDSGQKLSVRLNSE
jgi:hypothetical protein